MMEGISHEAADLAGHLGLGHLICIFDDNKITIDGATDLTTNVDMAARFRAYGWDVVELGDIGDDLDALEAALNAAKTTDQPSFLMLRTHIARPSPKWEDDHNAHGNPFSAEDVTATKEVMGIPDEPFWAPDDLVSAYREPRRRAGVAAARAGWSEPTSPEWVAAQNATGLDGWDADLPSYELGESLATRKAIQKALDATDAEAARPDGRLRRPEGEQRGRSRRIAPVLGERPRRPLSPLRHPRARHGRDRRRDGAARRRPAGDGHVLRVRRLHAPVDPPRRTLRRQGLLRVHPRLGRRRRGRPDAPAGRATRQPAGDPEPARGPPRRRQRDDPGLGRHRPPRRSLGADPQPPEHHR